MMHNFRNSFILSLLLSFLIWPSGLRASEFGDVIGMYRGQPIHSNVGGDGTQRTKWGVKWQCVEFVNRFYNQVMGMPNWVWAGNASEYWQNKTALLDRYPNGGAVAPQVDDILIWGRAPGRRYGHVAIITEVASRSITVAEQNWSPNGFRVIARNCNRQLEEDLLGWLRKPVP